MAKNDLPYRPCVGIMLVNADSNVFVGQRIDNRAEAWQMPQGGVDPGEDQLVAAQRELFEETGVTPSLTELIATTREELTYDLPDELVGILWKGRYRGQQQRWYLMRFTGSDADVNIETEHPEFREWAWKPIHQLPDLIVPFKRDLYKHVLAEFSPLV